MPTNLPIRFLRSPNSRLPIEFMSLNETPGYPDAIISNLAFRRWRKKSPTCCLVACPKMPPHQAINSRAKAGEVVFDVILVQPDQWWYGIHAATPVPGRWPGGVPKLDVRKEVYSRAYFKLKEALLWSGIRIQPGDVCVELGSAPGGACQLLLEMGAQVIGIDPAEMEPALLEEKNFTHIRRRGTEVRKRDLKSVQWLLSDMSTDPGHSLEVIEHLLEHESINPKGLILTMKLSEWDLLAKIPEHIQRVHKLGFQIVKVRQLAFNRREYCLAAIKNKFVQRNSRRKQKSLRPSKQS
jgi:23S rRNA (cytidine2498-2'-O)-methyltransferase